MSVCGILECVPLVIVDHVLCRVGHIRLFKSMAEDMV